MPKTLEQSEALALVASRAEGLRAARDEAEAELAVLVAARIKAKQDALEEAVMEALDLGNPVTEVARAYTPPDTATPNRVAIYGIRKRRLADEELVANSLPFQWVPREVQTFQGTITVYEVAAHLNEFGPGKITGDFQWYWDVGELAPIVDPEADPYPNSKFYQRALAQWLSVNPYPGEE